MGGLLERRILTVVGAVVYTVALNYIYTEVVSPINSYRGFVNNSPPVLYVVLSGLVAIVPSLWMPVALRKPSQVVYWMLYVMVVIPASVVPMYALYMQPGQILTLTLTLFGAFALLGLLVYGLPTLRLPSIRLTFSRARPQALFWAFVAALGVVLYARVLSVYGFSIDVASILDVYDVRAAYRESLEGSAFTAYAINWLGNAIFPLLIVQGLLTGNRVLIPVGLVGQLTLFSITGYKSMLFSSILLLAILFGLRARGRSFGPTVIWGCLGLVLGATIGGMLLSNTLILNLAVTRTVVTPGLLTGFYFDFFSVNEPANLGHSIFRSFVDYPYTLTPPFLIGQTYYGNAQISANANVWADGFANFRYVGVLAYTLLLGLVLRAFDGLARGRDMRAVAMLLGVAGFTFSNTSLLTTLLTHGVGLMFILLYLLLAWSAPEPVGTGFEGRPAAFSPVSAANHQLPTANRQLPTEGQSNV